MISVSLVIARVRILGIFKAYADEKCGWDDEYLSGWKKAMLVISVFLSCTMFQKLNGSHWLSMYKKLSIFCRSEQQTFWLWQ